MMGDLKYFGDEDVDWEALIPFVLENRAMVSTLHGPEHWSRVHRNAVFCAQETVADLTLLRLFALLHDWQRQCDVWDPLHGERAADSLEALQGRYITLEAERIDLLYEACAGHAHGQVNPDPTIGACWDGDRLDLRRIRRDPSEKFMSTTLGQQICRESNWKALTEFETTESVLFADKIERKCVQSKKEV